jgi:hypothetical protein
MEWLILALVVGAVLPVIVAACILLLGASKSADGSWGMATAFGKGIGLGAAGGLALAGVTIGVVLTLVWLIG